MRFTAILFFLLTAQVARGDFIFSVTRRTSDPIASGSKVVFDVSLASNPDITNLGGVTFFLYVDDINRTDIGKWTANSTNDSSTSLGAGKSYLFNPTANPPEGGPVFTDSSLMVYTVSGSNRLPTNAGGFLARIELDTIGMVGGSPTLVFDHQLLDVIDADGNRLSGEYNGVTDPGITFITPTPLVALSFTITAVPEPGSML